MRRMLALPILLALPLVVAAQPDDINYLYLELGYGQTELDVAGPDIEGNGLSLEGSVPIREHIHVFGGYGALEFDGIADADSVEKLFGVGTNFSFFDEKLSVYGRLGFIDADIDIGAGNVEDDGLFASGGVRYMPLPGWEIRGGFEHVDLDLAGSDTAAVIGSDLFVTDVVALTIKLKDNDDASSIAIGARFYFGNEAPPASFGR